MTCSRALATMPPRSRATSPLAQPSRSWRVRFFALILCLGCLVHDVVDSSKMCRQRFSMCVCNLHAGYAAQGDFENMVTYSTANGYKPDYLYLMQRMMMDNPEAAVNLAKMVAKQPGPPIDLNTMTDLFLQVINTLLGWNFGGQNSSMGI